MENKKYNIASFAASVASIICMLMPYGVKIDKFYYSYFNLDAVRNGIICPFIMLCLTLISLFLIILNFKYNLSKYIIIIFIICINISLISWFIFNGFTLLSAIISIFHLIAMFFVKNS